MKHTSVVTVVAVATHKHMLGNLWQKILSTGLMLVLVAVVKLTVVLLPLTHLV
jgi:hypothetical protein